MEVVGPERVDDRVAVQRAAFARSTFTAERWHEMSQVPAYARARCLVGYDGQDNPVAAVTVWSAGPGRPGLLEPVGVHRDHRGHGHGTAISLAAAAALRDLGASSATVATSSSNTAAVATYAQRVTAVCPTSRTSSTRDNEGVVHGSEDTVPGGDLTGTRVSGSRRTRPR